MYGIFASLLAKNGPVARFSEPHTLGSDTFEFLAVIGAGRAEDPMHVEDPEEKPPLHNGAMAARHLRLLASVSTQNNETFRMM